MVSNTTYTKVKGRQGALKVAVVNQEARDRNSYHKGKEDETKAGERVGGGGGKTRRGEVTRQTSERWGAVVCLAKHFRFS